MQRIRKVEKLSFHCVSHREKAKKIAVEDPKPMLEEPKVPEVPTEKKVSEPEIPEATPEPPLPRPSLIERAKQLASNKRHRRNKISPLEKCAELKITKDLYPLRESSKPFLVPKPYKIPQHEVIELEQPAPAKIPC